MKWLPDGWQWPGRSSAADKTMPVRGNPQYGGPRSAGTKPYTGPYNGPYPGGPDHHAAVLSPQAKDVDVSSTNFRNFLAGGGSSGFCTVLCAATIAEKGGSFGLWFWQLVFAAIFLWFLAGSRGMLSGRGFLFDRGGFYIRTKGEVFGIVWDEIAAVGVGTLPWIQHRRPVPPGQRHAWELYPADRTFPGRHPELDRWLIEEPPPRPGLPSVRYRFFLPPFGRLPKQLERAARGVAAGKWIGRYRRELPAPRP